MDFNFDLAPELAGQFAGSINGEGIRLPWDIVYFYWRNGSNLLRAIGGPQYFGGWAATAEDVDMLMSSGVQVPSGLQLVEETSRQNNKPYQVYATRALYAAVIGFRERWSQGDNGKTQSHLQVLAYLGDYNRDDRSFSPIGPSVLTGKGWSGAAIKQALGDWERKTQVARKKYTNGLPAHLFYTAIGTFGGELNTRMVGNGGAQSPITPCTVAVPQDVSVEFLRMCFVGRETAQEMADLKVEAEPWLNAWKDREGHVKNDAPPAPEYDNYGPPPPVNGYDDGIPF